MSKDSIFVENTKKALETFMHVFRGEIYFSDFIQKYSILK